MDFIGPLPRTARGHDVILVVVDKLTRWVYYIPARQTASAQETFALLDRFVLANHDTPKQIVSDRDTRFTSHFWEDLWAAMRTQLKRSTSFHPQTDGQTERANRTLIEQLRSHVDEHQADWDLLLPQLQRANNSAMCFSTGFSPFEMNHGRKMRTELDAELEADGVAARAAVYPGAVALAERRARVEAEARERIKKAQEKQRRDAQQGRRAGDIAVGDKVWLSNRNLRLDEQGRARKLEALYFGPYEVLEMHGSNAAKIQLPLGSKLHPVFNLDLLRRFVDGKVEFPERPVRDHRPGPVPEEDPAAGGPAAASADDEPEYEVEAIIGSRGRGARQSYRVKWLGWPVEQASWRPAAECRETCPDRVREFEETQQQRRRAVHVLRAVEEEKREQRARWSLAGLAVQRPQEAPQRQEPQRRINVGSIATTSSADSSHAAAAPSFPSSSSTEVVLQQASTASDEGSGPEQRSQRDKEERAGTRSECMKTTTIDENKEAAGRGGNDEERQGENRQQRLSAQALLKAAEAGPVAAPPLLSPLAQDTSLMLSTLEESSGVVELAGRTWSSVAAGGVAAAARREALHPLRRGGRAFSVAVVSSGVLQRGDSEETTNRHTQGLVRDGHAKGAAVVQDGGVVESLKVAAGRGECRDSMRAPLPWIPAAGAGAAVALGAMVSSHANTSSAGGQGGQLPNEGVSQADRDSAEEQRMGALMKDSVPVGERSVPGHHNKEAQQWRRVSTGAGGVASLSPPSDRCSDARSEAVEPHGPLSLSFPVAMHPPTPHMGPLRMQRDGR
jgi:hypothetical protein